MGVRSRLAQLLSEAPPAAQAVEFELDWWTWGQLADVAARLDALLSDHGLGPGARVGVVLENRPEHVAVAVGLLADDRCLVTFSPLQPPARLGADLRAAAVPVVLGSAEVWARTGVLEAATGSGLALELGAAGELSVRGGSVPDAFGTSDGVAIEMLTSGTTGSPKRVLLRDEQLDGALESSGQVPKKGVLLGKAVGLVSTPLVHIGGLWGAVSALHAGRRIVLQPRFQLEAWVCAVERHRIRAAGLVPAALRAVLDAGVEPERLASLQAVTSGTAPCPPEVADDFFRTYGARVLMTYGATEFAGAVAGWTFPLHEKWWDRKRGSAGRPFPGVALRVVDAAGGLVPGDEIGHLEVRTRQSGADGWVRTSDLGVVDADGFLWVHGRADDAIVRGGFKVHPHHVKAVLERHHAVLEAAVAGVSDARLGEVPVAAVELREGAVEPSEDELRTLCREHLTPYEVPVRVVVVPELPRTPSSKVSRVDLLELLEQHLGDPASVA